MPEETTPTRLPNALPKQNSLIEFANLCDSFVIDLIGHYRNTISDQGIVETMTPVGNTLIYQMSRITESLRQANERLGDTERTEISNRVENLGGIVLINESRKVLTSGISQEKAFLADGIFKEIKKIIRIIINFLKKIPFLKKILDWIDDEVINLIDEILSLFLGKAFPISAFKKELSDAEVRFLRELYEVEKLTLLRARAESEGDTDD
jgi:hypothetical protein